MTTRRAALASAVALVAACAPDAPPAPVTTTTTAAPPTLPPTVATTTAPTTAATVPPTVARVPPPTPAGAAVPVGVAGADPPTTVPAPEPVAGAQTARASWYGSESGSRTADGTAFDGSQMVFAHRTMRFGTMVRFCHAGACVVARCADRGPAAWTGKTFDLSRAAFQAIAPLGSGVITVEWSVA